MSMINTTDELIQQQNDRWGVFWTEEHKKEFVSLIVKQCVEQCSLEQNLTTRLGYYYGDRI